MIKIKTEVSGLELELREDDHLSIILAGEQFGVCFLFSNEAQQIREAYANSQGGPNGKA